MQRTDLEGLPHGTLVDRLMQLDPLIRLWQDDRDREHNDQEVIRVIRAVHVDLRLLVGELLEKVNTLTSQQGELDADVQQLTDAETAQAASIADVGTHLTNVEAEIAALKQQIASGVPPQSLDLTGLTSAVGSAKTAQAAAASLLTQISTDDPPPPPPVVDPPVDPPVVAPPVDPPVDGPPVDPPVDSPPADPPVDAPVTS